MFELSKEQKAVILLSRLTFSRENVDDIKNIFLNGKFNWLEFVKYTTYHKTLTLNFYNLTSLISESSFFIPRYIYTLYRSFYNSISTINLQQEKELHQILHDARARSVILIPVKGIHILHDLYKNYGVRFSGDMDILLRKHDVEKVSKVVHENNFFQKNYNSQTDEFIDISRAESLKWKLHMSNLYPYRKRSNMDVYPFFKVDFRFALDDRLDEKPVLEMIESYEHNGYLAPHYYLLHLCTHFYNEAKYTAGILYGKDLNLIKMCDIREYVLAHREENVLPEVIKLAKRFDCKKAVYYTMHILNQVYHDGYEREVMDLLDIEDITFLNTFGDSTLTDTQTFKKGFWERFFACGNFDELTETPKLIQKF